MKEGKIIVTGNLHGNLYCISLKIPKNVSAFSTKKNESMLLHRRMGHSARYPAPYLCDVCMKAKQTRKSFVPIPEERKAKGISEVVSTDVCGPIKPTTYDGKIYFVTFVDHYSHFCVLYVIERKDEVCKKFEEYINLVQSKFGTRIERLTCDNGGEYVSEKFKELCRKNGIKIQYTVARNPEQNGVAERFNRTIMEKARCLMFDADMDKIFWGEAVRAAVYLINRTETSALPKGVLPAEIWYGCKQDLRKIKLFGCIAYNFIPKEDRKSKLDARSEKLIMIGYADNGYRL